MSVTSDGSQAVVTVKTKHRAMWALGNYPLVASTVIPDLGATLVEAAGIEAGDHVLDVAAGPGNAALPAARRGAEVIACDLSPELLEAGRRQADREGLSLEWLEADAETLPFDDGEFDKVISCVGVMFAPDHRASAGELARVCRPGGTIALISWTSEGFVGQMLAATKPYVAPPPPGALPAPLWGDPDHVTRLLGEHVSGLATERRAVTVDAFASPEAFRDFFKANYGPTVAAYRGIEADPQRTQALDDDLADLARRHDRGSGPTVMDWEYLLVTARRR